MSRDRWTPAACARRRRWRERVKERERLEREAADAAAVKAWWAALSPAERAQLEADAAEQERSLRAEIAALKRDAEAAGDR